MLMASHASPPYVNIKDCCPSEDLDWRRKPGSLLGSMPGIAWLCRRIDERTSFVQECVAHFLNVKYVGVLVLFHLVLYDNSGKEIADSTITTEGLFILRFEEAFVSLEPHTALQESPLCLFSWLLWTEWRYSCTRHHALQLDSHTRHQGRISREHRG